MIETEPVDAMSEQNAALVVSQVTKTFPSGESTLRILAGVDLTMQPGDAVAVTGPSGTGKSTLLYLLGLLDHPTSGDVVIGGERPHQWEAAAQARFRGRKIGFIFQDHHLLPQCTVLENVLLPTLAVSGADRQAETRARELLASVGLQDRLWHRPAQLSGGEKQRVAVCRALINEPMLLLADEPTGNLDPRTAESVGTLLLDLARDRRVMLICVTHSRELACRFPRRYELKEGLLVEQPAQD